MTRRLKNDQGALRDDDLLMLMNSCLLTNRSPEITDCLEELIGLEN